MDLQQLQRLQQLLDEQTDLRLDQIQWDSTGQTQRNWLQSVIDRLDNQDDIPEHERVVWNAMVPEEFQL